MFCMNCGHEIPEDSDFCPNCGKRVEQEDDRERTIVVGDEEDSPSEPEEPLYCTNCGQPLSPGDAFCMNCGTPADSEAFKSPGTSKAPRTHRGHRKVLVIGAAVLGVVCVAGAAGFGLTRLLIPAKVKVISGLKKTVESALDSDASMSRIIGIDDMIKETKEGRSQHSLELSLPTSGLGLDITLLSNQKDQVSLSTFSPKWNSFGIDDIVLYQQDQRFYAGIPDAMDEVIYLDMEEGLDELSDSYLGELLRDYTGEDLADYFSPKEDLDFIEYCSDELMAIYDSMEVKKDGKQKLTIDGKSQNCTQYQVLIPGDCLVDLFEAIVEYSADLSPAVDLALRESGWEDFIRSFEIEDMELTMCLDKKGRLVASEGEIEMYSYDSSTPEIIAYDLRLLGGGNPSDQIELDFDVEYGLASGSTTLERNKTYDKDSGLEDTIEIFYGGSTWAEYNFSYDSESGDWELSCEIEGDGIQAEGEISDLKRGKAMTFSLDDLSLIENGQIDESGLIELRYQFGDLEDKIEEPFDVEEAISVSDLDEGDLENMTRELIGSLGGLF